MERVSSEDQSLSPQGLHLTPSLPQNCLLPGAGRVHPSTSEVPRAGSVHLHTGRGTEVPTLFVTQSLLGNTSVTENSE